MKNTDQKDKYLKKTSFISHHGQVLLKSVIDPRGDGDLDLGVGHILNFLGVSLVSALEALGAVLGGIVGVGSGAVRIRTTHRLLQ